VEHQPDLWQPAAIGILTPYRQKVYGNTAIAFYRREHSS
jgi:hypothetical protein